MRLLILLASLVVHMQAPDESALPVVRAIETLSDEQNEILLGALKAHWEASVVTQSAVKSTKSKQRAENRKRLESLRTGGMFGHQFEELNTEKLKLKRVLTVNGSSLNSGSYRVRPLSLVDDENIIVEFMNDNASSGETIWLSGIDVSAVLSDDKNVEIDAVFVELEPKSYTNTSGAKRSVKHWQALKPSYVDQLWEDFKKEHSAELSADFDRLCKEAKSGRLKSPYEQP